MLTEFRDTARGIVSRQEGIEKAIGAIGTTLEAVTQKADSVTDLSRRIEHFESQVNIHQAAQEAATQAAGSVQELGQKVLGEVAKLRRDMEQFARDMNRPFPSAG
jgi:methyl-accepting chemotaxis protein